MIVRSMIEASSDAIPFRPTHSAYLACGAVVVSYWRQMSSAIFSCFSSPPAQLAESGPLPSALRKYRHRLAASSSSAMACALEELATRLAATSATRAIAQAS